MRRYLFLLLVIVFVGQKGNSQFRSIDLEISTSPFFDDRTDDEYPYKSQTLTGIVHAGLGYSNSVSDHIVLSCKAAYGRGFEKYTTHVFFSNPNVLPDSNFYEKLKESRFLKLGVAASYWFAGPGKGAFAEVELQNITGLYGKSKERVQIGYGAEIAEKTVDFSDELKHSTPSMRIGIGYNLAIKRVSLFIRFSLEFRGSTYFKTTDNFTLASRSLGMGVRYNFKYFREKNKKIEGI